MYINLYHNIALPSWPPLAYNEPFGKSHRPNELSHEPLRVKRQSLDIKASETKCKWSCNALLGTPHDELSSVGSWQLFNCPLIDPHAMTYYLSPNKKLVIEEPVLWLHETIKSINNWTKETLV